jgi:uncharacterized membrane protein
MKTVKARIAEIKTNGYELDFGIAFENAFENYKKIAVYAGLMLFVFFILLTIIMSTGIVSYVGVENMEEFSKQLKHLTSLKVMPLNIAIPVNGILILISGILNPFIAGFLKMADCGEKGEEFHVSTMFTFYKSPYFINLFMATLIVAFFSVGLSILFQFLGLSFIGTVISLTISFITLFTVPLIVFGKLNTIEAIRSSIIIVSKQPIVLFGLIIVTVIGVALGLFGFCIGLFFTWPFLYSMEYSLYNSIIGIDYASEIDELGSVI